MYINIVNHIYIDNYIYIYYMLFTMVHGFRHPISMTNTQLECKDQARHNRPVSNRANTCGRITGFIHVYRVTLQIPSGELTFCNGKSPFLMGKSTISMAIFNCYVSSPEGTQKMDENGNMQY